VNRIPALASAARRGPSTARRQSIKCFSGCVFIGELPPAHWKCTVGFLSKLINRRVHSVDAVRAYTSSWIRGLFGGGPTAFCVFPSRRNDVQRRKMCVRVVLASIFDGAGCHGYELTSGDRGTLGQVTALRSLSSKPLDDRTIDVCPQRFWR
jgi:hypothetical protein